MKLEGRNLSQWLLAQNPGDFPYGTSYVKQYSALEDRLNAIHKEVTPTSIAIDGGYLTDHGPDHIRKLIQRLTALAEASEDDLSPYEVYILLVAAHFHDVGNIYGREGHELKSQEIMTELGMLLGIDAVEKRSIWMIAQAHGGKEKDKISELPKEESIKGYKVRLQLLAAILKFGDELAEDSERAARFSLQAGLIPSESEIYHTYAACLHSVVIDSEAREILMSFEVTRAQAIKKFTKKKGGVERQAYLVDEIFERTVKAHYERVYCGRFMRRFIDLDAIRVKIEVIDDRGFIVLEKIGYRLAETGYPDDGGHNIYDICPELLNWQHNGKKVDGVLLAQSLLERS